MLPTITLIITFINEPRSTLLRTLVSVYERTDPSLLKEIILVDDNNEDSTVGKELEVFLNVMLQTGSYDKCIIGFILYLKWKYCIFSNWKK